jgi:hypothetical protein
MHISFQGRDLRLFSGRGSTAFRDRTVTGLKAMIFPPGNFSDPQQSPPLPLRLSESGQFNLSFREEKTGTLIQDIQDEIADPLYLNQKEQVAEALGPHYSREASSAILLTQQAQWSPECFTRRGTYHRREKGELISFGVESRVLVSETADEILQELEIENRLSRPLVLTVIPDQPRPGRPRVPCFVSKEDVLKITVVSDLGPATSEGWRMEIPARSSRTACFALRIESAEAPTPHAYCEKDLAHRASAARHSVGRELIWASDQLPHLHSDFPLLDEFYRRSILSVLLCRRQRENFVVQPFYDLGAGRGSSTPWDMAFSGHLLAQLDPKGLLSMLLAFFSSGSALACSYLSWQGKPSGWYAQTPFSLWELVQAYIRHTGDAGVLEQSAGTLTVFQCLRDAAQEILSGYVREGGLLDLGPGTKKMLEIRTEGYQHMIAAVNALGADYFEDMADLCRRRNDSTAEQFATAATRMRTALNAKLWNEEQGWYENLYPDGTRHLVLSYHVFDTLGTRAVPLQRKRRLAERIRDGEFLATYGMFSISPTDHRHFDLEDCDWGGGGQYVGQSLKIVEMLYRIRESGRAWDLLSRCARWTERFPYFPQTIYGERLELQRHQVDWPLQISAGAGAQAIIGGVFGLTPQFDGSLLVAPHYQASLGAARLTNYIFRGNHYAVTVSPSAFQVFRNDKLLARARHGNSIHVQASGAWTVMK